MKTTGRCSEDEELERNPEKPFLKDIKKDIEVIDLHFKKDVAINIKKLMIQELLNSI